MNHLTRIWSISDYSMLLRGSDKKGFKMDFASREPALVLDAPDLSDDFYLNLLDWGPQEKLILALDRSLFLYDISTTTANCMMSVVGGHQYISAVGFSNYGAQLVAASSDGCITIQDASSGSIFLESILPGQGRIASIASSSRAGQGFNESVVYFGLQNGEIIGLDVRMRPAKSTLILLGHTKEACGLRRSPDSWQLASGGNDNQAIVWDIRKSEPLISIKYEAAIKAINWCPWRRGVLAMGAGTMDRRLRVWNTLLDQEIATVNTESQICGVFWSESGRGLVSTHGFEDNEIKLWEWPSLSKAASVASAHTERIVQSAISPAGCSLATAAGNESLKLWNLTSQRSVERRSKPDPFFIR